MSDKTNVIPFNGVSYKQTIEMAPAPTTLHVGEPGEVYSLDFSDFRDFTPRKMAVPGHLTRLAEMFLKRLRVRQYSKNTINAYQVDLEQFIGYCLMRDVAYIQHVRSEHVDGFMDSLMDGEGCSPRTAERKRQTLRSFFNFSLHKKMIKDNPVDDSMPIRFEANPTIAPDTASLLELIQSIPDDTIWGKRDRAFFRLLFDSAHRCSEILRLDLYNDDSPPLNAVYPNGTVMVIGKGGRAHCNPIDDTTLEYVNAWLEVRGRVANRNNPALFVSNHGGRVTRESMHMRLKRYGKQADLPHVHMHHFRHRRLGDVYEKLGPREAQMMANHKHMRTTLEVYGHLPEYTRRALLRDKCKLGE